MTSNNSKYFNRNTACLGWNQNVISSQVALILGVGGLGNPLTLSLCRLGFKKLIIVDKDEVEASNLNRQILFSKTHIGCKKVSAAKQSLDNHHALDTEIEVHNICALQQWNCIVQFAQFSTCIFNTIDHGDYFDFAITSLARSLSIPVVHGGTDPVYGTIFSLTISKIKSDEPCWACFNDLNNKKLLANLSTEVIQNLQDVTWIPPDPRDECNGSNAYTAAACAQYMIALMIEYLMPRSDQVVPDRIINRLLSFDSDKFFCDKNPDCYVCHNK